MGPDLLTAARFRGRAAVHAAREEVRLAVGLRRLPAPVAWFFLRARLRARLSGDAFSLVSAARPAELATLIGLARGRGRVVELGTGTAWTAIALALADVNRIVVSYDPVARPERERYLALLDASTRSRVALRTARDDDGPEAGDPPPGLVFVDSSHACEETLAAFRAWRPAVVRGGVIAFHDYGHPDYPGVAEAIAELGLDGGAVGGMFVWRAEW